MFNFSAEELLCMDYRTLRQYTERAVLQKPSLGMMMRKVQLSELLEIAEANPMRRAKIRCISAYLGVEDPYPVNKNLEEA